MHLPHPAGPLRLRRLRPEDLQAFQRYRQDPELARYQGWSAQSDAQALLFLNQMQVAEALRPGVWFQLGIADAASDELLGDIGLCRSAGAAEAAECEIGFTLSRPAQGRGLATAAVRATIALVRAAHPGTAMLGATDARNTASIRLLERLGFVRQRVQQAEFKGEQCEEWIYRLAAAT